MFVFQVTDSLRRTWNHGTGEVALSDVQILRSSELVLLAPDLNPAPIIQHRTDPTQHAPGQLLFLLVPISVTKNLLLRHITVKFENLF